MKRILIKLVIVFVISLWLIYYLGNKAESKPGNTKVENTLSMIIDSLKIDQSKIYFFIDKSDYTLAVMAESISLKTFAVVFGPDAINDKLREGDGCTPEGWFIIQSKYPHKHWNKFMWLDYPNKNSWKKHNDAIANKTIDKLSGIGGEIGIHGVPTGTDDLIDKKYNWTAGCVSLKNKDVEEIYACAKAGKTKVFIQK